MAHTAKDHDFIAAALAGELGSGAQDAAFGVLTTAETHGYADDTTRVAGHLRAELDETAD